MNISARLIPGLAVLLLFNRITLWATEDSSAGTNAAWLAEHYT